MTIYSYGQNKIDPANVGYLAFSDYDDLRQQQKNNHVKNLCYVDSPLHYKVGIPNWLTLKETNLKTKNI